MGLCLPPHGAVSLCLGPGSAQEGSGGLEFVTTKDTMCIWWSPKLLYYSTKSLIYYLSSERGQEGGMSIGFGGVA